MPLKYLYRVTFADGSTYEQNAQDRSITEPDKRSCFTDVRARAAASPIVTFELYEVANPQNTWSVDLTTGRFQHNGAAFDVSDGLDPNEQTMLAGATREIVFWRRHTHEFTLQGVELGHGVRYDLGWQANVGGKNYQRLIHIY